MSTVCFVFWGIYIWTQLPALEFTGHCCCLRLRIAEAGDGLCFRYWGSKPSKTYLGKQVNDVFNFTIIVLFPCEWFLKQFCLFKMLLEAIYEGKPHRDRHDNTYHSASDTYSTLHDRKQERTLWLHGEEFLLKTEGDTHRDSFVAKTFHYHAEY